MTAQPSKGFLHLPPKVRMMAWKHALHEKDEHLCIDQRPRLKEGLLSFCQLVCRGAVQVYYSINSFRFKKPENAFAWLQANDGKKMQHTQTISCVLDNLIHSASISWLLAECTTLRPWKLPASVDHLLAFSEARVYDFLHGFVRV